MAIHSVNSNLQVQTIGKLSGEVCCLVTRWKAASDDLLLKPFWFPRDLIL